MRLLCVFLALVMLNGCVPQKEAKKKEEPQTGKTFGKWGRIDNPGDDTIRAHHVVAAFQNDYQAARKTYVGKRLVVQGHVYEVEPGNKIHLATVNAKGQLEPWSVTLYMEAKEEDEVVTWRQGEKILFVGTCDGKSLGVVLFKKCRFIEKVVD